MEQILDYVLKYTPLMMWAGVLAVGLCLERFLPQGRAPEKKNTTLPNLLNGLMVSGVALFLMPLTAMLTTWSVERLGAGFIDLTIFPSNTLRAQLATAFMVVFIYDFFFYFWHRIEHRVPFLWHIHAVHHSDTHLNITTYIRQHWLEQVLQGIFIGLPVALLFMFSPFNAFAATLFMVSWDFFTHMNIKLDMGPVLGRLLVGPQYHRVHHSLEKRHQDVNFAQIFPIIDIVFRTHCPPEKEEYPATGLYSGDTLDRPVDLFVWPFRQYWNYFKKR